MNANIPSRKCFFRPVHSGLKPAILRECWLCKQVLALDGKTVYAISKKGATYYGKFFNSFPRSRGIPNQGDGDLRDNKAARAMKSTGRIADRALVEIHAEIAEVRKQR